MPSVTGGSSLVLGFLEVADGRQCSAPLPPVRSARTVSLVFSSWVVGMKTPVISSQAPHHRLHHPAPRGPFHGPLVAVYRNVNPPSCSIFPGECPEGRTGRHAMPTSTQPLSRAGERMHKKNFMLSLAFSVHTGGQILQISRMR